MISIRFKVVWILVALIGAYLVVSDASAQGVADAYTVDGVQIEIDTEFYDNWGFTVDVSTLDPSYVSTGGTFTTGSGDTFNLIDESPGDGYISFSSGIQSERDFTSQDFGNWQVNISGTYPVTLSFFYNENYTVTETAGNITWGTGGIWGSETTTDEVRTDLVASVQATGANLWPMLLFLGVVLAFAIFGYVITSIKDSVKPKNARRGTKNFDPVSFNRKADELMEFYSKNGGASDDVIKQIRK